MPKTTHAYSVIVGNLGYVYDGTDRAAAMKTYRDHVRLSKSNTGRVAGELVSLFIDHDLDREYHPPTLTDEDQDEIAQAAPVYVITRKYSGKVEYLSAVMGWISGPLPKGKTERAAALNRLASFDTPLAAASCITAALLSDDFQFKAPLTQLSITVWEDTQPCQPLNS